MASQVHHMKENAGVHLNYFDCSL